MTATSVIIVNYNGGKLLAECVGSVMKQDCEVIVVDNASTDDSLSCLIEAFSSETGLTAIRAGRNLGFAAACNLGMQTATGRCLLFLNPDCIVAPNALEAMTAVLFANGQAGMAGPLLLNPDGTEQPGGRRAVPTPWRSFVRTFSLSRWSERYPKLFTDFLLHREAVPDGPAEVEAISGACMLVKREALEAVGPMDENYFLHCEDLDWCMRFRQKGWKILFVPGAWAIHHQGTCSESRPLFVEWHKHRGMVLFYEKFFRHQYPGILLWIVKSGVWIRFSLLSVYLGVKAVRGRLKG